MELTVNRKWKENDYTVGKMYVNGIEFSDTLEDKDRGLNDARSLKEISQRKV